jgi:serine/threonine protein kinase
MRRSIDENSLDALDLIRKCLTVAPSKRFTVDDIAAHRWVNIGFTIPPVHGYVPAPVALTFPEKKSLTYEPKPVTNGHETDSQKTTTMNKIKAAVATARIGARPMTKAIELRSKSLQARRRTSREKLRYFDEKH